MRHPIASVLVPLCLLLSGCVTYYQVHDPTTNTTYYTTEIDEQKGGAVSLKDARTNAHVTIQTSEIMEITEEQYDAAIRTVEVIQEAPARPVPDAAAPSGEAPSSTP